MKKIFMIVGVVLMLGMVLAANGPGSQSSEVAVMTSPDSTSGTQGSGDGALASGNGTQVANTGEGQKIQLRAGEHVGENGQQMMIKQESKNQIRLEVGGKSANTSMRMRQEVVNGQTKLSAQLSNGRDAEIKVMPDKASETALERLRLRNCVEAEGCSIELKEVGVGEKAGLAYEVKTQRQSRILGLFGAKMQVQAQVDAENGEVLNVNKPWWAFLASEPAE